MISLKEFINQTKGKVVGFTDTTKLKGECVTLIQEYIRQCYDIPFKTRGNAKDWINTCSDIATITTKPKYGDIIVWGANATSSGYGHVAIYIDGKQYYDQFKGKSANYATNSIKKTIKPVGYLHINKDRKPDEEEKPLSNKFNLTRLLKKGVSGNDVKELQKYLNDNGWRDSLLRKLTVDGIFGNNTLAALKKMQKKRNLLVDGIVGKQTANSLGWLYFNK